MAESENRYKVETIVSTSLGFPHGIAFHKKDGTIYVADQNNNRLIKIEKSKEEYQMIEVHLSGVLKKLDFPGGLVWDFEGRLLIANTTYQEIQFIDVNESKVVQELGPSIPKSNSGSYSLEQPRSMAIDKNGHLLVVNCYHQKIAKIDLTSGLCIAQGVLTKECALPQGIAVDTDNNIIYADRNKHTIKIMDSNTLLEIRVLAGTGREAQIDGTLHEACFVSPCGVAIDPKGIIYVSEYKAIRKIDRAKDCVSTILTGLDFPLCMTFDNQGNLLFTEYVSHCVKRIILNQRMPWNMERLLWIGLLKNPPQSCPFARLPKEMLKEVVSFYAGNVWQ